MASQSPPDEHDFVRFLALSIALVLVWWNDNAFYGGNVDALALVLFLGMLRAVSRSTHMTSAVTETLVPVGLHAVR